MKNLMLRLKNPVFVSAMLSGILLALKGFGVIKFDEDIDKLVNLIITVGVSLGVWVNPITPGLTDK